MNNVNTIAIPNGITWLSIVTDVATILSVIFIAFQYWNQIRKQKVEKSIEMSEKFAKEIILNLSSLINIYNGLFEPQKVKTTKQLMPFLYSKIDPTVVKTFDKNEIPNILKEEEATYLNDLINFENIDGQKLLETALPYLTETEEQKLSKADEQSKAELLKIFLSSKRSQTLNLLEYISMNFTKGIANKHTAYQSLHMSFFMATSLFYICIANNNTSNKDKYFTNIISLYNSWREKFIKQCEKEDKIAAKCKKIDQKAENKKQKKKQSMERNEGKY